MKEFTLGKPQGAKPHRSRETIFFYDKAGNPVDPFEIGDGSDIDLSALGVDETIGWDVPPDTTAGMSIGPDGYGYPIAIPGMMFAASMDDYNAGGGYGMFDPEYAAGIFDTNVDAPGGYYGWYLRKNGRADFNSLDGVVIINAPSNQGDLIFESIDGDRGIIDRRTGGGLEFRDTILGPVLFEIAPDYIQANEAVHIKADAIIQGASQGLYATVLDDFSTAWAGIGTDGSHEGYGSDGLGFKLIPRNGGGVDLIGVPLNLEDGLGEVFFDPTPGYGYFGLNNDYIEIYGDQAAISFVLDNVQKGRFQADAAGGLNMLGGDLRMSEGTGLVLEDTATASKYRVQVTNGVLGLSAAL